MVKKPEAYTGSRLAPGDHDVGSTCQLRKAARAPWRSAPGSPSARGPPRGSGRSGSGAPSRAAPLPTGPPRASGVFSAAPASRKCMPSTACQSIGWVDAGDGEGDGEPHRARRERRRDGPHVGGGVRTGTTRSGMSKVTNTGTTAATVTTAVAAALTGAAVARQPRSRPPVGDVERVEADGEQEGDEERDERRELVRQDLLEDREPREARARAATTCASHGRPAHEVRAERRARSVTAAMNTSNQVSGRRRATTTDRHGRRDRAGARRSPAAGPLRPR